MVGVAGKSQGCGTCRARKKKCDLQRPFCANCLRTERKCQGYERYAVFVNRTAGGITKRRPLEEVKPAPDNHSPSHSGATALALNHATSGIDCNQVPALDDTLLWFAWDFARSDRAQSFLPFTVPVLSLSNGPLASSAIRALGMLRIGDVKSDDEAYRKGQVQCVHILKQLQRALDHPQKSKEEDTLACAAMLGLLELTHSVNKGGSTQNWLVHLAGLETLLAHQGSSICRNPIPWAIHCHIRRIIMMRSLLDGQPSVLGRADWLEATQTLLMIDPEQLLCNCGLRIPWLGEACFQASKQLFPCIDNLRMLLYEAEEIFQTLKSMHQDCKCFQLQPPNKVFAVPARENILGTSPMNEAQENQLVQCTLLMGMQLKCCAIADLPATSLSAIDLDKTILLGDLNVLNKALRLQASEDVIRLIRILAPQGIRRGNASRIIWVLKLAYEELRSQNRTVPDFNDLMVQFIDANWSVSMMRELKLLDIR